MGLEKIASLKGIEYVPFLSSIAGGYRLYIAWYYKKDDARIKSLAIKIFQCDIEDHVHLSANLSPIKSISDTIRDIRQIRQNGGMSFLTILVYLNGRKGMELLPLAILS